MPKIDRTEKDVSGWRTQTMPLLPWQVLRTFRDRTVLSSLDERGQPVLLQNQVTLSSHSGIQAAPVTNTKASKGTTLSSSSPITSAAQRGSQNSPYNIQEPYPSLPVTAILQEVTINSPHPQTGTQAQSLNTIVRREGIIKGARYFPLPSEAPHIDKAYKSQHSPLYIPVQYGIPTPSESR